MARETHPPDSGDVATVENASNFCWRVATFQCGGGQPKEALLEMGESRCLKAIPQLLRQAPCEYANESPLDFDRTVPLPSSSLVLMMPDMVIAT